MSKAVYWSGTQTPILCGSKALVSITRVAAVLAIALMLATSSVLANDNPMPPGYDGTQEEWEELGIEGQKNWHDINVATQELVLSAAQAALAEIQEDLDAHLDAHGELPDFYDWLTENGAPAKPSLADYDSLEEYEEALSVWWASLPGWAAENGLTEIYDLVSQQHILRLMIRDAKALVTQAAEGVTAAEDAKSDHCTAHPE